MTVGFAKTGFSKAATLGQLRDVIMPTPSQGSVPAWHVASAAFLDTVRAWGIAATSTCGLALSNTTPATSGVPVQRSPGICFGATVWDTSPGVSRTEDWQMEVRPSSGAVPYSTLYMMRRQDAGAWANPFSFLSSGSATASSSFIAPTLVIVNNSTSNLQSGDLGSGLGACVTWRTVADMPCILQHTGRADGANNIVFADDYDPNAASITNAATMRLRSFGWTNDSNVYAELAAIFCDGHMVITGPLQLPSYAVAGLPAAGTAGRIAYCSDDAGGACLVIDNGSNWVICTDLSTAAA